MTEIERKFIVKGNYKHLATQSFKVAQAYLSTDSERTARIRIKDDKGFITIKGKSDKSGMERYEWEKEIPVNEAEDLLALCLPGKIEKIRHHISYNNYLFEVDEFLNENAGLVIAEVELKCKTENPTLPPWIDKEVTGDKRYYNSYLSNKPFCTW